MHFANVAGTHLADDHQAGMHADAHRDSFFPALTLIRGKSPNSFDNVETGKDRSLSVVVVCDGISKVSQHAIACVLMNVSAVAADALHAHLLVG